MTYFDPHIHMVSRTTDDYQRMYAAGIVGVIEPAFWQGQPRTSVGSFIDYFDTLLGWERFRASQFGIHHYCTMGLNPKEANDLGLANEVMAVLPRFLAKDGVVAVGEIGYDDITPEEELFMAEQMQLAMEFELPVLVHTPHRDKIGGTKRTIALIREVGIPEHMVIIDHLNEQTLPLVMETDCWRGHSIYPNTKMSEHRMVTLLKEYGLEKMVVNSAADWGCSDPLKVPKTGAAMRQAGYSDADITKVLFDNPIDFFAQSGRISKEDVSVPISVDQTRLWESNSALRGQTPIVES
ncbi:TatD family hydrolase [Photobacterium sp. WH77]|uniref:TatD family hydrolase n=1 Tax=unclassified Photobacterium TaxID=2628852 RepID=UPI001EDABDAB|nr:MULTISPECIES: TatD family hydrolase [unclassified Photobacterium]MCG2837680.1 TatD family hydrolase [Photobacterium sp. WH77]MCG2845296.1 TatD family hydrolase [Photobacterium sp. WH80]